MISKIITFQVKTQHLNESLSLIEKFTRVVHYSEPGTRVYLSLQSKENKYVFKHVMIFDNEGAEEVHRKAGNTVDFVESIVSLCEVEPVFEDYLYIGGM